MVQRFDKEDPVIDLGCGVGQTACFMHNEGFENYRGCDFSDEAINRAKQLIGHIPSYKFYVNDIFTFVNRLPTVCNDQFFCSETLEHITDDTGLLRLLAERFPGSRIAISVPTFDDPSHVRVFKSVTEAKDRYKPFIDVDDSSQIGPWIILQGKLAKQL